MKLLTTISADYVPDWGFYEGVRELVQNGLDAQDKGFRFDIIHLRDRDELLIYNEDTYLTRSNLLLGNTSKRGDETQRGVWGEGFKIGILALIRGGRKVTIINGPGREVITPSIDPHPDYGGVKVLCFDVNKHDGILPIDKNKLIFKINGVTAQDVTGVKDKFLHWGGIELGEFYKTSIGRVLLPERYKGKVFARGIYVCEINKLAYGYDFDNLELGRDRNLASQFNVCWSTSRMWGHIGAINGKDDLVIKMLKSGAPDVEYISNFVEKKLELSVYNKFIAENGDNAYPCSSEYQKKEAVSLGLRPIFVPAPYGKAMESFSPNLSDLKKKQVLNRLDDVDITQVFSNLMGNGWRIKRYPCDCGGKYAWLRPDDNGDFHIHGCICHNTPLENLD